MAKFSVSDPYTDEAQCDCCGEWHPVCFLDDGLCEMCLDDLETIEDFEPNEEE